MKNRITGCIIFLLSLTMIVAQDWEIVKEQSNGFIPNNGFFLDASTGWLSGDDGEGSSVAIGTGMISSFAFSSATSASSEISVISSIISGTDVSVGGI